MIHDTLAHFLDVGHTCTILQWVHDFKDVKDRTRVGSFEDIAEEDWTLNISRYVQPPIGEDIPPLPETIAVSKTALTRVRKVENALRKEMEQEG